MKTKIFEGIRRLDMDPDKVLYKSTAIYIAMKKIRLDLEKESKFKGDPYIVRNFPVEHKWGWELNLTINNKSGTYEDMDYMCFISNNEIFEHIINELKNNITAASFSAGYIG